MRNSSKFRVLSSKFSLFLGQRDHRIDSRRASGGQIARGERHDRENGRSAGERDGIARAHAEEHGRHEAAGRDRDRQADDDRDGRQSGGARDDALSGKEALDAFLGMASMNRALFASLSSADRAIALSHPEYGALTVDWIIQQMAGHQIHHLAQLEQISART